MSEANFDFISYIQTLDNKQLKYIAAADYRDQEDDYFDELKKVIIHQSCIIYPDQQYMPGEVISLCSNALETKHAKEYIACNLLLILNRGAFDNFSLKFQMKQQKDNYENLSEPLRDLIIRAYKWAGFE